MKESQMDDQNKAVISAIMQLSNNLHFKTVSEGVETDEQVEFIKEQGGKYVQGYYFYKPMPPEEFEGLLEGEEEEWCMLVSNEPCRKLLEEGVGACLWAIEPCRKPGGKMEPCLWAMSHAGSLKARWCLFVSNEPCRKLAGKLLRFCGRSPYYK